MKSSFPDLFPFRFFSADTSVYPAIVCLVGVIFLTSFFCSSFLPAVILSTFLPRPIKSSGGSNAFRKTQKSRFPAQADGKKIRDNPGQDKSRKERFRTAVCRRFCFCPALTFPRVPRPPVCPGTRCTDTGPARKYLASEVNSGRS